MEILIVEDDSISRSLLKRMLNEMGHQVVEAENGQQAWELLRNRPLQYILTDWMMPEMDGLALCQKIRSQVFDRYIYIIMLTAKDHKVDLFKVFNAGADDYLSKPFNPEELRARLKTGLRIMDLEKRQSDEIQSLNDRLSEQSSQIAVKNQKLEKALNQLENTQAQMFITEKMASIGQLAAGVAHEINNPTGYVANNLKTLDDYFQEIGELIHNYKKISSDLLDDENHSKLPEHIAGALETIKAFEKDIDIDFLLADIGDLIGDCREGTDRIKSIVRDLKNFAHSGDDTLQLTDINQGLNSTLNVVANEIKYKAAVHTDFNQIPAVRAYPQQLNQVFMNILVNAAQAIEENGEIHLQTRLVDGFVEVVIKDTGCGISKENISKIFDPFFTTKEVGSGTGLGMNIAYNIIQKHNGRITIDSEEGKGTAFTIRIPAVMEGDADDQKSN